MSESEHDPFEEALGTYIGPSTVDELVAALHEHSTGPVIERVCSEDGTTVSHRDGWALIVAPA